MRSWWACSSGPSAGRRPDPSPTSTGAGEPWTRGCYGAHLPPGAWTQLGPALRPAVGRIHWAGTETADRWSGYIDGAIRSGERVAVEILAEVRGG